MNAAEMELHDMAGMLVVLLRRLRGQVQEQEGGVFAAYTAQENLRDTVGHIEDVQAALSRGNEVSRRDASAFASRAGVSMIQAGKSLAVAAKEVPGLTGIAHDFEDALQAVIALGTYFRHRLYCSSHTDTQTGVLN